ncbi:farnesyl-diphosphate synthase [Desulfosarcina ovata subsp. sediminis]|uniref:Farnesyl-diphosphate synthase n=1 Tax=Desulfosarcina ovata subsp. sediminis TaxID=885957 RepID=A0A5K7ZGY7_9BACT|nr:farnesyl diphosphate synthase [Desulfosarcina ovata]BBO80246.1 farnesyl-diphosphate synthase [Desulfosarcina ovata subsp. sediminis]
MGTRIFDLKKYLSTLRQLVDEALQGYLEDGSTSTRIGQAMHYSVMAGGKRLRPILCIAAAETLGGDRQAVLPLSCALECIHTYSLIHDDLPAMDNDVLRRGNPTCHVKFDEATAILAGDALLTLAFEILADTASRSSNGDPVRWTTVIAQVAAAAGYRGMIEGQMRDIAFEGIAIDTDSLKALHRLKTGRMIEVSVASAATVCCASQDVQQALQTYSRNIGLAFQVADDILNVKGDPLLLGKSTGTDQMRGKNTYAALLGLAGAEQFADQLINKALNALDIFDSKADSLRAIARYVIERKR